MSRPEVLAILEHLGLRQADIARRLHVPKGTVSRWTSGQRQMSPAYERDLWALATILQEHLAQGGTLDDLQWAQGWQPTSLENTDGSVTHVAHMGPFPRELVERVSTFERQHDVPHEHGNIFLAISAIKRFGERDLMQGPLTAVELETLRNIQLVLGMEIEGLQKAYARRGMAPLHSQETLCPA